MKPSAALSAAALTACTLGLAGCSSVGGFAGAAAAFATVVFVADGALPGTLRLAAGALSVPQRFVLAVVFAAALAAGMRLAPERMRRVSPSES